MGIDGASYAGIQTRIPSLQHGSILVLPPSGHARQWQGASLRARREAQSRANQYGFRGVGGAHGVTRPTSRRWWQYHDAPLPHPLFDWYLLFRGGCGVLRG
jgi:hypothetical protein